MEDSGHNEITLSSLSTSDYRGLKDLTDRLIPYCEQNRINMSVPSLRADNFSRDLMQRLQSLRKSSLTFAPEAGTQRLRDVINKNLSEEEILTTCANAFSGGWNSVKLYLSAVFQYIYQAQIGVIARVEVGHGGDHPHRLT